MRSLPPDVRLLHAQHDLAHARAETLRRQARDEFWRGADAVLSTAAGQAVRACLRLGYRLRRRARAEGAPAVASPAAR